MICTDLVWPNIQPYTISSNVPFYFPSQNTSPNRKDHTLHRIASHTNLAFSNLHRTINHPSVSRSKIWLWTAGHWSGWSEESPRILTTSLLFLLPTVLDLLQRRRLGLVLDLFWLITRWCRHPRPCYPTFLRGRYCSESLTQRTVLIPRPRSLCVWTWWRKTSPDPDLYTAISAELLVSWHVPSSFLLTESLFSNFFISFFIFYVAPRNSRKVFCFLFPVAGL